MTNSYKKIGELYADRDALAAQNHVLRKALKKVLASITPGGIGSDERTVGEDALAFYPIYSPINRKENRNVYNT